MPLVSVIVPVFNVEAYLQECLASLQQQTLSDLEVIVVDDASSDRSAEIARRFEAADPRFRVIGLTENGGQGRARNLAIEQASGHYLAFADGDDVVPPDAYERLVASLEATGSDLAAGNVRRVTVRGSGQSGLHAEIFTVDRPATHISAFPALVRDTCVWNKVYRLDFWRRHELAFTEGAVFEDMLVAITAHTLARSVDLLSATVYAWQERHDGTSTTQQRLRVDNFLERLDALTEIRDYLDAQGLPNVRREHDVKVLDNDLLLHMALLPLLGEIYGWTFVQAVQDYLSDVDPALFERLHAIHRLEYHLLGRGLLRELMTVLRFEHEGLTQARPIIAGGRAYGDYPFRGDSALAVPDDVYELHRELEVVTRIDDISWLSPTELELVGTVHLTGIEAAPDSTTLAVRLVDVRRPDRVVTVPGRIEARPDVAVRAPDPVAGHLWSGVRAVVNVLDLLADWPGLRTDDWAVQVEIVTRGIRRTAPFAMPEPGRASRPRFSDAEVARVNPYLTSTGELRVRVHVPHALADSVEVRDGTVTVTGEVAAGRQVCTLRAVNRGDGTVVHQAAQRLPGWRFEAAFTPPPLDHPVGGEMGQWELSLETIGGQDLQVHVDPEAVPAAVVDDDTGVSAGWTWSGLLRVSVSPGHLDVHGVELADGLLTVTGASVGLPEGELELWLESRRQGSVVRAGAHRNGRSFTVSLPTADDAGRPAPSDLYRLVARLRVADGTSTAVEVVLPLAANDLLPLTRLDSRAQLRVLAMDDALALMVEAPLPVSERGAFNQARLIDEAYSPARHAPLEHAVVFESWGGKYAACNPRALQQELLAQGHDASHHWVVRDLSVQVPDGASPLLLGSSRYYELMGRARWIVSNNMLPTFFDKREGQIYLQTWHGTPLKRLAFDLVGSGAVNPAYLTAFARDVAQWDYLISPNEHSTDVFRRAFRYVGEVLETGYPRNDLFASPEADLRRALLRERLGAADTTTVVLYAPTWRDDAFTDAYTYAEQPTLDYAGLQERFGHDVLVLFRGHHVVIDTAGAQGDSPILRDVSRHPDVSDLYLAADVLVTDYSSTMFDFVLTGRPILFFTYDLERYRDTLRGFYLDFEQEAPGPLLRDAAAVTEALADLADVQRTYAERYRAFADRFTGLEDGKASARVIDRVFAQLHVAPVTAQADIAPAEGTNVKTAAIRNARERMASARAPHARRTAARAARAEALARIADRDFVRTTTGRVDARTHVVVVAPRPSTWGSVDTVCEALAARPDVRLTILAVEEGTASAEDIRQAAEGTGYPTQDLAWFEEHAEDIDVLVVDNPWDVNRVPALKTEAMAGRGIRLVYLPYANNVGAGDKIMEMQYDRPLHHLAWRIYARSPQQVAMYDRYGSVGNAHVRVAGLPKLDRVVRELAAASALSEAPLRQRFAGRTTFLWNPHYTVGAAPSMRWSTFDRYLQPMIQHFAEHPDQALILRPHPLLFPTLAKLGGEAATVEALLRRAASELDNVHLDEDPDYRPAFAAADAMLSDVSSLITEFYLTGKPMALLTNIEGPGYNEDAAYFGDVDQAHTWQHLQNFLGRVHRGEDPLRQRRQDSLARHFPLLDGRAGERIAEEIVADFRVEALADLMLTTSTPTKGQQ